MWHVHLADCHFRILDLGTTWGDIWAPKKWENTNIRVIFVFSLNDHEEYPEISHYKAPQYL